MVGFWISLELGAWQWSSRASIPLLPEVRHGLILTPEGARLQAGEAEVLADQEIEGLRLRPWLGIGATVLISLGLAGTFLGLTLGLFQALPHLTKEPEPDVSRAIELLLDGAKLAFVKSLLGILLGTLWTWRLVELREQEEELRRGLLKQIHRKYPPISAETLMVEVLQMQIKRAEEQSEALQRALAAQTAEAAERQQALLVAIRSESAAVQSGLRDLKQAAEGLQNDLKDLGEHLPGTLGPQVGRGVGAELQPTLGQIAEVLGQLGSAGTQAISETLRADVGQEIGSLQHSLQAITEALNLLPAQLDRAGQQAVDGLDRASGRGAEQLQKAVGELAAQATETGVSVQGLKAALAQTRVLVGALRQGGENLSAAFERVVGPLVVLPGELDRVREGVQQVGGAASEAAGVLKGAGVEAGVHLREGGAEAARVMSAAATRAQESLDKLGAVWQVGGEGFMSAARRTATELREAQSTTNGLVRVMDELREACLQTVQALAQSTGAERQGADQRMQEMLAAVATFSEALRSSQEAVQSASFGAVASTEQVTALAARAVADALVQGAERMTDAMARGEQLGVRIDAQAQAFAAHMLSAQTAATEMARQGEALVSSGARIKDELEGVGRPLDAARRSLELVPASLDQVITTLREEQKALGGLAPSLKEQAALIHQQEVHLGQRAQDLRDLLQRIGQEWNSHLERMVDAQDKVSQAWAVAMEAARTGADSNASRIAQYATKVQEALGLNAQVANLQESLADLVDALKVLERLDQRLGTLGDRLGTLDGLPAAVEGLRADVAQLTTVLAVEHLEPDPPSDERAR